MIDVLETAAREAGKTLLTYFRKELTATRKTSHQNIVTEADMASQARIRDIILAETAKRGIPPGDVGFIGEENLRKPGRHLFVIDPLDGTNNFASGFDYFGISIGYLYDGAPVSGIIYRPATDTFVAAGTGHDAFRMEHGTRHPMHIAATALEDTLAATYMSSDQASRHDHFLLLDRLVPALRGLRILGAASLDLTHFADSRNNINVVLYRRTYLWDIAAAHVIIRESGGVMTDWSGKPIVLNPKLPNEPYRVLVCHPGNLSRLVGLLAVGQ